MAGPSEAFANVFGAITRAKAVNRELDLREQMQPYSIATLLDNLKTSEVQRQAMQQDMEFLQSLLKENQDAEAALGKTAADLAGSTPARRVAALQEHMGKMMGMPEVPASLMGIESMLQPGILTGMDMPAPLGSRVQGAAAARASEAAAAPKGFAGAAAKIAAAKAATEAQQEKQRVARTGSFLAGINAMADADPERTLMLMGALGIGGPDDIAGMSMSEADYMDQKLQALMLGMPRMQRTGPSPGFPFFGQQGYAEVNPLEALINGPVKTYPWAQGQ